MRYSVSDLVKIFGKTQPTIAKWIRSVEDGGLLSSEVYKGHVFLVTKGKRKKYEIDDVAFAELTKQRKVVLENKFDDNPVSNVPDVKKEIVLEQQKRQIDLMKSMILDLRSTNETYKKTIDTYNSIIEDQKREIKKLKKGNKKWWQFWK